MILLALACSKDEPAPSDNDEVDPWEDYVFEPFVGSKKAPDALNDRLCVESADPEAHAGKIDVDCDVEGASFAPEAEPKDSLRVVAWNLERGYHVDEQIAWMAEQDADVFLISEADRGCARTGGRNIARDVAEGLALNYVYGVEFIELPRGADMGTATPTCEHGNFLASRYPLGNVGVVRHAANDSWYSPPDEGGERRLGGRMAVHADIEVGDTYLSLYVLHFESRVSALDIQNDQAEEIALLGLEHVPPVIAGGDTNAGGYVFDLATDKSLDATTQAFLSRGYLDSHAELPVEERGTLQGLVIDLMFGREELSWSDPEICAVEVCEALSDHQAVAATVRFP